MFHGVEGCPGQELLDPDPETILASVQNGAVQTFSCFVADSSITCRDALPPFLLF